MKKILILLTFISILFLAGCDMISGLDLSALFGTTSVATTTAAEEDTTMPAVTTTEEAVTTTEEPVTDPITTEDPVTQPEEEKDQYVFAGSWNSWNNIPLNNSYLMYEITDNVYECIVEITEPSSESTAIGRITKNGDWGIDLGSNILFPCDYASGYGNADNNIMFNAAGTYSILLDMANVEGPVIYINKLDTFTPSLTYSGSVNGNFDYDKENEVYVAEIELDQWNNVEIDYIIDEMTTTVIWYNTADVYGDVTAENYIECDWTKNLFHVADKQSFYCFIEGTYRFTYDPVKNELFIEYIVIEDPEAAEPTDETFANAFMVAKYNTALCDYAVVYDSSYNGAITLGEYTIATDASGKIIYASRTSDGYGGPADGFYHDGTYAWEAGKVCGIFSLDAQFDQWPTVTEDGQNAWSLYTVVCPEGYHIITGSKASMAKLIKALADVTRFDSNNDNSLFEFVINDGTLNKYQFSYEKGNCCIGISYKEVEVVKALGVYVDTNATEVHPMTLQTNGTYYGVYTFNQWNHISLLYSDGYAYQVTLWYDTCTVLGDVVPKSYGTTYGKDVLYEDNTQWYRSESGSQNYSFTYDPAKKTLSIEIMRDAEGVSVITNGVITTPFTKQNDGTYIGVVTLAQWNHMYLDYTDSFGNSYPIWYTNTAISGLATEETNYSADWSDNLYHEDTTSSRFYRSKEDSFDYKLVYDPVNNTLVISANSSQNESLIYGTSGEVIQEMKKQDDGSWYGIFKLSGWNSISFSYSADGINFAMIWYDNTTVSGNVTAADKEGCPWTTDLYHEGDAKAWYHYGDEDDTTYKFIYTPANGENAAALTIEIIPSEGVTATTAGTEVSAFAKQNDGTWMGIYTLSGWNSISLIYSDGLGSDVLIWYDNTTISGAVTASDKDGCTWTTDLYHEGDSKVWYHYGEKDATTYMFIYNLSDKSLSVSIYNPVKEEGTYISTNGTIATEMTKGGDGAYRGKVTLAQWKYLSLVYSNGTVETTLWYDTCTVIGDVVNAGYSTTYGQNVLYIDNNMWYRSESGNQNYEITYNPSTNILIIEISREDEGVSAITNGTVSYAFSKQEDGTFKGVLVLKEWNHLYLDYTDTNGESFPIWYTTASVNGAVTAATSYDTDWTTNLYHPENYSSRWITCTGGTYKFVYNPSNGTLVVTVIPVEGLTVSQTGTEVTAMAKQEDGTYYGEYTLSAWKKMSFYYSNGIDDAYYLWDDTCTVIGDVVNVDYGTTYGKGILYRNYPSFQRSESGDQIYQVTYNPTTNVLMIVMKGASEGITCVTNNSETITFTKNEDGTYSATATIAQWKHMYFDYTDASGKTIALWYTSGTTIDGSVTASTVNGTEAGKAFYHDVEMVSRIYCYIAGTYKITYNPTTNTLTFAEVTAD